LGETLPIFIGDAGAGSPVAPSHLPVPRRGGRRPVGEVEGLPNRAVREPALIEAGIHRGRRVAGRGLVNRNDHVVRSLGPEPVRDRDARGVLAGALIGVRRRGRTTWRRHAAGARGAVTPADLPGPRGGRRLVGEPEGHAHLGARPALLIGAGGHRGSVLPPAGMARTVTSSRPR